MVAAQAKVLDWQRLAAGLKSESQDLERQLAAMQQRAEAAERKLEAERTRAEAAERQAANALGMSQGSTPRSSRSSGAVRAPTRR